MVVYYPNILPVLIIKRKNIIIATLTLIQILLNLINNKSNCNKKHHNYPINKPFNYNKKRIICLYLKNNTNRKKRQKRNKQKRMKYNKQRKEQSNKGKIRGKQKKNYKIYQNKQFKIPENYIVFNTKINQTNSSLISYQSTIKPNIMCQVQLMQFVGIIVVKKFSVSIHEIQQLMNNIFTWYYQKCTSLNIQINIPNVAIDGAYQISQFKKFSYQIKQQINQKLQKSQIQKLPILGKLSKQQQVLQKYQNIAQNIMNRQQRLQQIENKFSQYYLDNNSNLKQPKNKQKKHKIRTYKRQQSFMQKTVMVAKQMRIRLFLFYICLVVSLTLGTMLYFGWFRDSQI